jgi:Zn ribbon nucleic-acid-binding protein
MTRTLLYPSPWTHGFDLSAVPIDAPAANCCRWGRTPVRCTTVATATRVGKANGIVASGSTRHLRRTTGATPNKTPRVARAVSHCQQHSGKRPLCLSSQATTPGTVRDGRTGGTMMRTRPPCPSCRSTETVLVMPPADFTTSRYRCSACGRRWTTRADVWPQPIDRASDRHARKTPDSARAVMCPRCSRTLRYASTQENGIAIYECPKHGRWHFGQHGLVRARRR